MQTVLRITQNSNGGLWTQLLFVPQHYGAIDNRWQPNVINHKQYFPRIIRELFFYGGLCDKVIFKSYLNEKPNFDKTWLWIVYIIVDVVFE